MILPSNESLQYKKVAKQNCPNPELIGMKINIHEIGLAGKTYFTEIMRNELVSMITSDLFGLYHEFRSNKNAKLKLLIDRFMCEWHASSKATPAQLIEYNRNMRIEAVRIASNLISSVHYTGTVMSISNVH